MFGGLRKAAPPRKLGGRRGPSPHADPCNHPSTPSLKATPPRTKRDQTHAPKPSLTLLPRGPRPFAPRPSPAAQPPRPRPPARDPDEDLPVLDLDNLDLSECDPAFIETLEAASANYAAYHERLDDRELIRNLVRDPLADRARRDD